MSSYVEDAFNAMAHYLDLVNNLGVRHRVKYEVQPIRRLKTAF